MSSIKVDPAKLEELSAMLKKLSGTIGDREQYLFQDITQLTRQLRGDYPEREVQRALEKVDADLQAIRKLASSVTSRLTKKSDVLIQAATIYRRDEEKAKKTMKQKYIPPAPSSYYIKGGGLSGEGLKRYLDDPLFQDPVVQKLHELALQGTEEEQTEAKKKLDEIFKARNSIARAQVAYAVYKTFGNIHLMNNAHKEAMKQREILKGYGISEDLYKEGVDLTALYKGSKLEACSYDPSFQIMKDDKIIPVLLPQDNQYHYLLGLIMEGGSKGAWAQKQLDEIHDQLKEIGRAQVAWWEYKAKNMKNEMDGAHEYAEKLRKILKDKYSLSSETVDGVDFKNLWVGVGAAGKAFEVEKNELPKDSKKPANIQNPSYFSQVDPKWKDKMYSKNNDRTQTIGKSGCGPTSMAMILSTLLGKEVTPVELCDFAIKNGYRTDNSGTSWGFYKAAANKYGLESVQTNNINKVKEALKNGNSMVIASMGKGHFTKSGHFIVIHGMEEKGDKLWFEVLDPNSTNNSYGKDGKIIQGIKDDGKVEAIEEVILAESKQYWIFENPKSSKVDDSSYSPNPIKANNQSVNTISSKAVKFISNYESFSAYVYKDQAGKDTIGYGHLIKKGEKFKEPLTESEARALFEKDIKKYIDAVLKFEEEYNLNFNQNQFDGLVSFTYNLGENIWNRESTLKKLLVSGKYSNEQIIEAFGMFRKYTDETGRKLSSQGLYNRRIDEAEVFLNGDYKRDANKPLP